jgi:hypothetical protein
MTLNSRTKIAAGLLVAIGGPTSGFIWRMAKAEATSDEHARRIVALEVADLGIKDAIVEFQKQQLDRRVSKIEGDIEGIKGDVKETKTNVDWLVRYFRTGPSERRR